jgi:biopolymer transport protein ExbD
MRSLLVFFVLTALCLSAQAQSDVETLVAEASQPVVIDLAIGVTLTSEASDALADAHLASTIPPRMAVIALRTPAALQGRLAAERELAAKGPTVLRELVAAESSHPVGLWIPAPETAESTRVTGEIRGLDLERVLLAMGSDVLPALETLASSGQGQVAARASELHRRLSQLDVAIAPGGVIRVEGQVVPLGQLSRTVHEHGLAQSALVTAPGDLPLNQMMPVLDALRSAGLVIEIQASSSAVVTINGQESENQSGT